MSTHIETSVVAVSSLHPREKLRQMLRVEPDERHCGSCDFEVAERQRLALRENFTDGRTKPTGRRPTLSSSRSAPSLPTYGRQ